MDIDLSVRKEVLDRALQFKYVDMPDMQKSDNGIFLNKILEDIEKILQKEPFLVDLSKDTDYISIVAYELVNHITLYEREPDDKFLSKINDFLNQLTIKKRFNSIICLYGLSNLPLGVKIGNLEIITPDFNDIKFKKDLEVLYGSYKNLIHEQTEFFDRFSWAKVTFEDYHYWNIRDILFKELELPYSILSLIMRYSLDVKNTVGLVYYLDTPVAYIFPLKYLDEYQHPVKLMGWSRHSVYNDEIMSQPLFSLSYLTEKDEQTTLEKRIIRSVRLFGTSRLIYRQEIKLLLIVFACETLLLSNTDTDFKKQRLSKKARKLLENDADCEDVYSKIRDAYAIRSKIAHSGNIDECMPDTDSLDSIFFRLIIKILKIKMAYEQIEIKTCTDEEWLERLIGEIIIDR